MRCVNASSACCLTLDATGAAVAPTVILSVRNLTAGYGRGSVAAKVLQSVCFDLHRGETVCLLGRNGSGRSTLVKALMGLLPWQGEVLWRAGTDPATGGAMRSVQGWPAHRLARAGLGYVAESRDVFDRLTVEQNLLLGGRAASPWLTAGWAQVRALLGMGASTDQRRSQGTTAERLDMVYGMFPVLAQRRHALAGVLSGGEQQMLSLSRTWMGAPKLMLVDEPTEGLAPQMIEQLAPFFHHLNAQGVAVLLVEQKLALARQVASRALVMGHGRIVWDGGWDGLAAGGAVRAEWLEV